MKSISTILILLLPCLCFAGVYCDGVDDYIDLPGIVSGTTTELTISCWVKADDASITQQFFGEGGGAAGYGLMVFSGSWLFYVTAGSNSYYAQWAATNFSNDTWYNLVGVYDGASRDVIFYVDGTQQAINSGSVPTSMADPGEETEICMDLGSASCRCVTAYFTGSITEVAVWSKILTANDITLLANSNVKRIPLQIQTANLLAYWPLNDEEDGSSGDGDTFYDRSTYTKNGTGNDGGNNTGLVAKAEEILSYP